ncbi:MAG: hypothetical protein M3015_02110 [Bacteroidota bacterium]|nr:hypothetical protein [Bacteroidota bacterium]
MNTLINGKKISIKEETDYPYGNVISFEINTDIKDFILKIRKPLWEKKYQ